MSEWIDHHWRSSDQTALNAALIGQENILGPVAYDGNWYVTVRAGVMLGLPENCALADATLTAQLVGIWA